MDIDDIDGIKNPWLDNSEILFDLSVAPFSQTPAGGRHYWFRQPEGVDLRNTESKLAHKVDTRANGGYVVAPPSTRPDGQYTWLSDPLDVRPELLPLPPQWILDKLTSKPKPEPSSNGSSPKDIPEGKRNGELASMAGAMRRRGMDTDAIYAALLVVNRERCRPPLPDDEVRCIAESIGRYEPTPEPSISRRLTDVGNAERFAHQHGANVRYCHAWGKWLAWDGRRWAVDDSGEIVRLAKQTARSIFNEAAQAASNKEAKEIATWATASERRERLSAMVALAQSEKPIPIAVDALDSGPWLLNVDNGTIDLRTGELVPHRQSDFLTKLCPVEYPTEAGDDPELWLSFLDTIFAGNAELIGFAQRLTGMALVGAVLENVLAIFHGCGANGKSVFVETICGMLGPDYAMFAQPTVLLVDRYGRHPTERADLFGMRLVVINETGEGNRLSESTVKQLTSRERIRARHMRQDSWEFTPTHSLVLATNHRPEVRGADYGIWRRLRLVPFKVTIPEAKRDKELADKLVAEWPQILRWAVSGCVDWRQRGLAEPEEVLVATSDYQTEQDTLGEWLAERCVLGGDYVARAADLWASYKAWSEARGEKPGTQTRFGRQLVERGFNKDRPSDGAHRLKTVYYGIGLVAEGCS